MPFTPLHMGPGIVIKLLAQGSFSLMIFGWAQIVMDIQPLLVMISGEGHLHGFSHTYIGALLLGIFAALSGKYLAEFGLDILAISPGRPIKITWPVSALSAIIGTFSHVLIDSVMHSDMQPFFPVSNHNALLGLVSIDVLHKICIYSGLIGGLIFFASNLSISRNDPWGVKRQRGSHPDEP